MFIHSLSGIRKLKTTWKNYKKEALKKDYFTFRQTNTNPQRQVIAPILLSFLLLLCSPDWP
jgi:hypothetical protein